MLGKLPPLPDELAAELRALAEKACAQEITEEEQERLIALLQDQPAAQSYWLAYVAVDARLRREFGFAEQDQSPICPVDAFPMVPPAADDLLSVPRPLEAPLREGKRTMWAAGTWILASAVVLTLLVGGVLWLRGVGPGNLPSPPAEALATLTRSFGAAWEESADAPAPGQAFSVGRHQLVLGIAEITFRHGAVAVFEAPADLEILGPDRVFVHSGQVVVQAEGKARGFVVETRQTTVVDQGTEFGVVVSPSSDTEVHVFAGSVVTRQKASGERAPAEQQLRAGQSIRYGATRGVPPQSAASAAERFVRRFPDLASPHDAEQPSNRSRFDAIHVAAAPAQVVIDGDLSEWNQSKAFRAACEPPYDGTYFVEGRMMYDRDFLYIAAHVGDPAPMRNIVDPERDPEWAWRGGAVQVRLSSDRSSGWPLRAANQPALPAHRPLTPEDVDGRLVHLTLWYFAPKEQSCLHLAYGMDLHGDVVNPPGFRGAFRRDENGLGYVVEYAIPWSLLNAAADPPQAGDVLAAAWNVHWSNDSGRLWQGHLVEVLNPKESGWTFHRAATWGRAIYEPG